MGSDSKIKINRELCKRVKCKHFTTIQEHRRLASGWIHVKGDITPSLPKSGLCSALVWSVLNGEFTDWEEAPYECPYLLEMTVL